MARPTRHKLTIKALASGKRAVLCSATNNGACICQGLVNIQNYRRRYFRKNLMDYASLNDLVL